MPKLGGGTIVEQLCFAAESGCEYGSLFLSYSKTCLKRNLS